ncbi:hypothetical protein [Streptomyces syringium]|uniref:hypothetical protein n=1 Tax=Streptomyces syringium TaxID=76729 RepID=UPI00345135B1
MLFNEQVADLHKLIEARFRDHHFEVITSVPGLGTILGDMTVFGTPDRLAAFGGVAAVEAYRAGWAAAAGSDNR